MSYDELLGSRKWAVSDIKYTMELGYHNYLGSVNNGNLNFISGGSPAVSGDGNESLATAALGMWLKLTNVSYGEANSPAEANVGFLRANVNHWNEAQQRVGRRFLRGDRGDSCCTFALVATALSRACWMRCNH